MTRFTKITTTTAMVFALGGGSVAMAQSPADDVYGNGGVADVVASGTPAPPAPAPAPTTAPSSGTLPETESSTPTPRPDTSAVAPATASTPSQTTEKAAAGDLPFTGFEAGFVGLAGVALLAGGVAMRRAARNDD